MKKLFLFTVAFIIATVMTAQVSCEVCMLDSAKLASLNGGPIAYGTYTQNTIVAGTTLLNGTKMKVTVPFDQTFQWVSATQPNGAHKSIQIGSETISMLQCMQGKDNPKDVDGGNPCNTLLAPTLGAAFAIEAKANGWIVVLHKGYSHKQYFVFENGSPLGYKQGLMTYANPSLGEDGLLEYQLTGDQEYNYLTADILLANTGFNKIAMIEDYFNDTLTSGIAWEQYRQNGVAAIAFPAYIGCNYLVGGAGTKMNAAAIVFVNGTGNIPVIAKGETVYDEYGFVIRTYQDVNLLTIGSIDPQPQPQQSGTCGPNLTWTLQDSVLTISGSGNMNDYSWGDAPWYSYRESISSVIIGNSVTSIGDMAFYQCSGLTSITIPNDVTSIGNYAFYGCSGLTSITIPNSVTSIGEGAFQNCSGLTSVTINSNDIVGNTSSGNNLSSVFGSQVTEYIIGNSVTSIGNYAFFECFGLTSITIPNSVTSIGYGAFADCSGLTSVTIPNSVTSIGKYAFRGCSGLTSITIPNSVTSIGDGTFSWCSGLTFITIPNSVTSIGESAFYGCSGLTSVTIPNSVTSIGYSAFNGCYGLTSVTIPNSVTSIGVGAFSGCQGLIRVEAPAEFFDLEEDNWSRSTKSLQNVTVNAGELNENELLFIARSHKTLKTIDVSAVSNIYLADEAFNGFYNLDTLILPSSLERTGYMMAAGCKNLKCITIPAPVTEIEPSAFENCRSMTEVTFAGNNVTRIDDWAFYNCHQLQNLVIPEGVSEIGLAAFYGCTYLNEVSLPASVQQIGDHAFANCTHMGKMHVDAVTPPTIDSKTFDEVSRTMPVYVPDGSVNSYQADVLWGQLNIVGASQEGTSLNNINGSNVSVRKIFENGQLYILLPDGTRYDATGKKVE